MSAGRLREAARLMREGDAFVLAVANLLENEASLIDGVAEFPNLHMPLNGARVDALLAVADAYLGGQS